jgi:hypothetical protein
VGVCCVWSVFPFSLLLYFLFSLLFSALRFAFPLLWVRVREGLGGLLRAWVLGLFSASGVGVAFSLGCLVASFCSFFFSSSLQFGLGSS